MDAKINQESIQRGFIKRKIKIRGYCQQRK
jgi:hypothetical protein